MTFEELAVACYHVATAEPANLIKCFFKMWSPADGGKGYTIMDGPPCLGKKELLEVVKDAFLPSEAAAAQRAREEVGSLEGVNSETRLDVDQFAHALGACTLAGARFLKLQTSVREVRRRERERERDRESERERERERRKDVHNSVLYSIICV